MGDRAACAERLVVRVGKKSQESSRHCFIPSSTGAGSTTCHSIHHGDTQITSGLLRAPLLW